MQIPILIVGAGPAGLCSSILLSRYGVRSLLVEAGVKKPVTATMVMMAVGMTRLTM